MPRSKRFNSYYFTAILGLVFAVIGFSYNAWRLEASEKNNTIRMAAFTVISDLAQLERVVYAAHYDKDQINGNPRKGWVKVGLIVDLSYLIDDSVKVKAYILRQEWQKNWQIMHEDRQATNQLINVIDETRNEIKRVLSSLN